jgi:hypothetical protein
MMFSSERTGTALRSKVVQQLGVEDASDPQATMVPASRERIEWKTG